MKPENNIPAASIGEHQVGIDRANSIPEEILLIYPILKDWDTATTKKQKNTMLECWSKINFQKSYKACTKKERSAVWSSLSDDLQNTEIMQTPELMNLFETNSATQSAAIIDTISRMSFYLPFSKLGKVDRASVFDIIADRIRNGMGLTNMVGFEAVMSMHGNHEVAVE